MRWYFKLEYCFSNLMPRAFRSINATQPIWRCSFGKVGHNGSKFTAFAWMAESGWKHLSFFVLLCVASITNPLLCFVVLISSTFNQCHSTASFNFQWPRGSCIGQANHKDTTLRFFTCLSLLWGANHEWKRGLSRSQKSTTPALSPCKARRIKSSTKPTVPQLSPPTLQGKNAEKLAWHGNDPTSPVQIPAYPSISQQIIGNSALVPQQMKVGNLRTGTTQFGTHSSGHFFL